MDDLVTWLTAQVAEDERLARACIDAVGADRVGAAYADGSGDADQDDFPSYPWGSDDRELAYMAGPGHPARVLAECDSKRRIIGHWPDPMGLWTAEQADAARAEKAYTLKLLALPYADHPGYRVEWRP